MTFSYSFVSEHPDWTFIRPQEFKKKFLNGSLDTFDAVFSYSSMEHSGLGKVLLCIPYTRINLEYLIIIQEDMEILSTLGGT